MSKSLVKSLYLKPPKELRLLERCNLVGGETADDYKSLFDAVATSVQPTNVIDWLYVKSVVDLTWEILRETAVKVAIIESARKDIVVDLLRTTQEAPTSLKANIYNIFGADNELLQWAANPAAKKEINERLAARGFPASEILARAYIKAAADIDRVDRRIANYEARKIVILREIELRNERLSRALEKASADGIDGEFTEAAE
jgi:hypothetical protein